MRQVLPERRDKIPKKRQNIHGAEAEFHTKDIGASRSCSSRTSGNLTERQYKEVIVMSYGWAGTILYINLTRGKVWRESSRRYVLDYVGGRGVNAMLLYKESKLGQSALNPEAPLIFGVGPLAGTGIPAGGCRTAVTSRSATQVPELYGQSNFGGYWGSELKLAGYDNLVIKGRAKEPTYIWIDNGNVELRDASGIWGKDTFETQIEIREELGDPEAQVACIGIAGENLVRCATIQHQFYSAGKNGAGAVMGSKNLKAVAVRGTKGVNIADVDKFTKGCEELVDMLKKTKGFKDWQKFGTALVADNYMLKPNVFFSGTIGNYERQEWAGLENLRGKPFLDQYASEVGRGCFSCLGRCMNIIALPGVGKGGITCSPYLWSWRVMAPDLKKIFKVHHLANKFGISSLFVGTAASWLMHMHELGLITEKDTDGIPFDRGSLEALIAVVNKTAKREGFGDILAEGLPKLAKKIGKGVEKYLITLRGSTAFNSEYRAKIGFALASAVTNSTHWHGGPDIEFGCWKPPEIRKNFFKLAKEKFGTEKAAIAWEYEGKARAVLDCEHKNIADDLLGICWEIINRITNDAMLSDYPALIIYLFSAATGVDMDLEKLNRTVDKVITLERAFISREGQTRKDDTLPERFFTEPLPDGPNKGRKLDKQKFEKMKDEYYALRGWDVKTGIPTREKLEEFGLKDVADELAKLETIKNT